MCRELVRSALTKLSECNAITILECYRCNVEWVKFVTDETVLEMSRKYKSFIDRLDEFYTSALETWTYPTLTIS